MRKGHPFPNLAKLLEGMTLRGWSVEELAERARISITTAHHVVNGHRVSLETIERVSRALLDNPPETATAAFLAEGVR